MSITTIVPINVTPEAASRVADLGMQRELEQMLEHTRQVVPGLQAIKVSLAPPYDTGDEPRVVIEPTMVNSNGPDNSAEKEWDRWIVNAFSPDVGQHFCLLTVYGAGDEA
jgi:hypothetical protein